jgi:hypothetical protein
MNKKWVNICYYLKRLLNDDNINDNDSNAYNVYKKIVKFCMNYLTIKSNNETLYHVYVNDWEINKYSDLNHFILMTIYKIINIDTTLNLSCENSTKNKHIYICPSNEDMESTINHMTQLNDIPTNKQGDFISYKILSYKRSYPLYDEIGSFNLERFNMSHSDYKKLHYYNWEYYASRSPIWMKRIKKHNGRVCNETKKILFENDSELEEFYELYGYDFDEQSLQIQELSLKKIEKISVVNWINSIYRSIYKPCELYKQDEDILNVFKEMQQLTF